MLVWLYAVRHSATPFTLQTLSVCFYQALFGVLEQGRGKIQSLASDRYPGADSLRREVPIAACPDALTGGPTGLRKIRLDRMMMRKLCFEDKRNQWDENREGVF